MATEHFQYRLWTMHVAVACVALVLGAALGGLARALLTVCVAVYVALMAASLVCGLIVYLYYAAAAATRCASRVGQLPVLARQRVFERRLARIRPGNTSHHVRRILGAPARVDGFGDRLYWSYRMGSRRYTVSFDPRRLVAKYSNGLARDVPANRL